jgi:hypothetical protein
MGVGLMVVAAGCRDGQTVWTFDDLRSVGGLPVTVHGRPTVVEDRAGRAVQFDGAGDALFVEVHPLAGMARFTAEVVFRPDAGGAAEQRFFHMQAAGSDDRVLFETRLLGDGRWFLDTYVHSGAGGVTLRAERFPHWLGRWYRAAIVVDGARVRHFVDGVEEMSAPLDYRAQRPGRTSVGVRVNMVDWFKGAIRLARFTPRPLAPHELLQP